MRRFNVTGLCVASEDYMVDISEKIEAIIEMINDRQYFIINRARQYGKTTTLSLLGNRLRKDYIVASISFEGIGDECFSTEEYFSSTFLSLIAEALRFSSAEEEYINRWNGVKANSLKTLGDQITATCENQKVVLLIDEVDNAGGHRIFLQFLGMLRSKYLKRKEKKDFTFHSVILAGITDIKNIKQLMVQKGLYQLQARERIYDSPWNIAAKFGVDMSFNPSEISTMLNEYEADHRIGMDIAAIANELYAYTNGYPFLVSRICKSVDEELNKNWTLHGVQEAVKLILDESNTLLDDLRKNLENNPELYRFVYSVLIIGEVKSYVIDDPLIELGAMYGFFKNVGGKVAIANRIFELRISNYFISKDSYKEKNITGVLYEDVVNEGSFNMELCLRKFAEHYREMFNPNNADDVAFLERHGRMLFLSYIKPLINGKGFYHIESQFTDLRRMDIVVDFGKEQFIIELKLWKGNIAHQNAYEQLLGYMQSKGADVGYLLAFDFRKDFNKEPKAEWVEIKNMRIFNVIV